MTKATATLIPPPKEEDTVELTINMTATHAKMLKDLMADTSFQQWKALNSEIDLNFYLGPVSKIYGALSEVLD